MTYIPQDQRAREAAENRLNETTFIAAGAGTGKTSTIVKRIVNSLCDSSRNLGMRNLAAITFTERAAAELRRRIRTSLQERASEGDEKAARALVEFDSAQIGTIHAFAKRILSNFPIEAGLPITFEILDQATSKLSIRDTASRFVQSYFDELDSRQRSIFASVGVTPTVLREFYMELNSKRLLVNENDINSQRQLDRDQVVDEFMAKLNSWFDLERHAWSDLMQSIVEAIEFGLQEMNRISSRPRPLTDQDVSELIATLKGFVETSKGGPAAKPFRDRMKEHFKGGLDNLWLLPIENDFRRDLPAIWQSVQESVANRVKRGKITFDDLIVLAAQLIEQNDDVRAKLHRDFQLIVVDEFQDTDPLQWKLISLITTPTGELAPSQGSLVLVGDAQQSIYSFRGADVATYLEVAEQIGVAPMEGLKETLSVNFRSNQKILNWVNSAFSHETVDLGTEFVQLLPADRNLVPDGHQPGVAVIGGPGAMDIEPKQEPAYIASCAHRAVTESWPVLDSRDADGKASFRPARYSDVVILMPARTSLDTLLDELTAREIPYRSSDSAIVFDRPVVRGLVDALKVVAGVEQPIDLWFALKSPLFGCDDLELLQYKQLGGRWSLPYGDISPELAESRVHRCLDVLARVKRVSSSWTPAAVMTRLIEECKVMSTYDRTSRGRFEFECLQMVIRQARSWSQAGGAGVTEYLSWIKDQLSENAREALPETDDLGDDAVRISTVHGVKGLEFPIVLLGGMANERIGKLPVISVKLNRFEFSMSKLVSHGYSLHSKALENADRAAEQLRVLYVAATRAKNHLVVSNLAKVPVKGDVKAWSGLYRVAVEATVEAGLASRFDQYVEAVERPVLTINPSFRPETADWLSKLPEIRAKSKAKTLVTPSTIGSNTDKGNQGTSLLLVDDSKREALDYEIVEIAPEDVAKLGNAFHQVMEYAVQARVREIDTSLRKQMTRSLAEYGVSDQEDRLSKMLDGFFSHPVMDRIYSADHVMPELAISEVNEDGILVEGFADLVIQEADALVVLDYKTNLLLSPEKISHYAKQLDAYAQIIQRATQYRVTEKILVHVLPDKIELVAV